MSILSLPHERVGESIVAVVVLRDTTIEEIQAHCRRHLAGFKCPRELLTVSAIPRNSAQKTIRRELLTLWESRTQ